ncbi:MAG: suppressor of fused domain protein, partial [Pedobacter sp.]
KFAELMLLLPKSIEFGKITGQGENDWLIEMLKETARFPHHYDTWLAIGHTLQATADMDPYSENTDYTGIVILPSVTFDEEFTTIPVGENQINIYSVFPLYENEMKYKIENGYNALLDKLIENDAKEIFDYNRANLLG